MAEQSAEEIRRRRRMNQAAGNQSPATENRREPNAAQRLARTMIIDAAAAGTPIGAVSGSIARGSDRFAQGVAARAVPAITGLEYVPPSPAKPPAPQEPPTLRGQIDQASAIRQRLMADLRAAASSGDIEAARDIQTRLAAVNRAGTQLVSQRRDAEMAERYDGSPTAMVEAQAAERARLLSPENVAQAVLQGQAAEASFEQRQRAEQMRRQQAIAQIGREREASRLGVTQGEFNELDSLRVGAEPDAERSAEEEPIRPNMRLRAAMDRSEAAMEREPEGRFESAMGTMARARNPQPVDMSAVSREGAAFAQIDQARRERRIDEARGASGQAPQPPSDPAALLSSLDQIGQVVAQPLAGNRLDDLNPANLARASAALSGAEQLAPLIQSLPPDQRAIVASNVLTSIGADAAGLEARLQRDSGRLDADQIAFYQRVIALLRQIQGAS